MQRILLLASLVWLSLASGAQPMAKYDEFDLDALERKLEQLLTRYTEHHPDVRYLRDLIEEARQDARQTHRQDVQAGSHSKHEQAKGKRENRGQDSLRAAPDSSPWTPRILSANSDVYLPDFSYAGYHWSEEAPARDHDVVLDIADFGARPNDGVDDTSAIRKALEHAEGLSGKVEVQFPSGRFIISDVLLIRRGGILLSGAGSGSDGTELHVPVPLSEMKLPPEIAVVAAARGRHSFSYWGGVIWVQKPLAPDGMWSRRIRAGYRGQFELEAADPVSVQPGTIIELRWCPRTCPRQDFLNHLLDGAAIVVNQQLLEMPHLAFQKVTVQRTVGRSIVVKEPLIHDIRPEWAVSAHAIAPLNEVGIQNISVTFPPDRYAGHYKERGFNALYLEEVANSWIRGVRIRNADLGLRLADCYNITVSGISTSGRKGHHSINMTRSNNILVTKFSLAAPTIHNPSFDYFATRNVFTDGRIRHARLDQHGGLNHQNLIDNVRIVTDDVGRLFENSGRLRPPTAGAFSTFWNISVDFQKNSPIVITDAPAARIIGLHGNGQIDLRYGPHAYVEGLNRSSIQTPSLFNELLKRRTGQLLPRLSYRK